MVRSRLRALLTADTHIGLDHPRSPRVARRRRGPDFLANTRRALRPAIEGQVDLVVHGGDLLYRSKVAPWVVEMALEPLLEVADAGVPVVFAPGNHERSRLPYPLLAAHRNLHIFDVARTVVLSFNDITVALAGFPCERTGIRDRAPELIAATGWSGVEADVRLLCLHQTVEGAVVGPADFVFRPGPDVMWGRSIPTGFAAVFAGHIHRHQVLQRDLAGRLLAAPVFYPGSVERTSFAERDEPKGFLVIDLAAGPPDGGRVADWSFRELPARPMVDFDLEVSELEQPDLDHRLRSALAQLDPDSIVRLRLPETVPEAARPVFAAATLRELAPPSMNIELRVPRRWR